MIILDLDGVLAEFDRAACEVHGLPEGTVPKSWDWYHDFGITDKEFWDKIHALGDKFYGELVQPYPWAREVLELVRGADDFVIMSSPSNHPAGYAGKKIWVDKYLDGVKPAQLIVGSAKHLLAGRDRLLVDDGPHNITAFIDAGGATCTFLQPWNCDDPSDRIRHLKESLEDWGRFIRREYV